MMMIMIYLFIFYLFIYLFIYLFKEAIFRVSIKLQEIFTPIIDTTFEK